MNGFVVVKCTYVNTFRIQLNIEFVFALSEFFDFVEIEDKNACNVRINIRILAFLER